VIIGLVMAVLNFQLNAITTNYILITKGSKILSVLGATVRIIITFSIAILLCKNNKYNFIAFLIGYSLHYVAVVFYGIAAKK
jgi:ATP synthase protein I